MTMKEEMIMGQAMREMDARMPYEETQYRNSVVAKAIAIGKKAKLTEDWVMKKLLEDVEEGFILYEQAVAIKDDYYKAVQEVAAMF